MMETLVVDLGNEPGPDSEGQGGFPSPDADTGDATGVTSPDTIKKQLKKQLDAVGSAKHLGGLRTTNSFDDPKICVGDYGPIKLPLSEEDKQHMTQLACPIPAGEAHGNSTDGAAHHHWQLEAEKFSITQPDWNASLFAMTGNIPETIGIDPHHPSYSFKLRKMVISEVGTGLVSDIEPTRAPGSFATLVVVLPSPYQGGEFRLRHDPESCSFHETSSRSFSFVWWVAGVKQEVLPLASGFRWALVYSLQWDEIHPVPMSVPATPGIESCLKSWEKHNEKGSVALSKIIYRLEHGSSPIGMKLAQLEARDLLQGLALKWACDRNEFALLHAIVVCKSASVQKSPVTRSDGKIIEMRSQSISSRREYHLKDICDAKGRRMVKEADVNEKDFLTDDPFRDIESEEDSHEYIGNGKWSINRLYRRTVLVVVPHTHVVPFLGLDKLDVVGKPFGATLAYFFAQVLQHTDDFLSQEIFILMCRRMVAHNLASGKSQTRCHKGFLSHILRGALQIGDEGLCRDALEAFPEVNDEAFAIMAARMRSTPTFVFDSSLDRVFSQYSDLDSLFSALERLLECSVNQKSIQDAGRLGEWAIAQIDKALLRMGDLNIKDVPIIMQVCSLYGNEEQKIAENIVPCLQSCVTNTPLAIRLMNALWKAAPDSLCVHKVLYRGLAPSFSTNFKLNQWGRYEEKLTAKRYPWMGKSETDLRDESRRRIRVHPVDGAELATLLDHFHTLGMKSEIHQVLQAFQQEADAAHHRDLMPTYITCLREISSMMRRCYISPSDPVYQGTFQTVFSAYTRIFVRESTSAPLNWRMPTVRCKCETCTDLNMFMQSSEDKVAKLVVTKFRRDHIEKMLRQARSEVSTVVAKDSWCHGLVVTKKFSSAQAKSTDQRRRKTVAYKTVVETVGGSTLFLKELLADRYGEIMTMSWDSASGSGMQEQEASQQQEPTPRDPSPRSGSVISLSSPPRSLPPSFTPQSESTPQPESTQTEPRPLAEIIQQPIFIPSTRPMEEPAMPSHSPEQQPTFGITPFSPPAMRESARRWSSRHARTSSQSIKASPLSPNRIEGLPQSRKRKLREPEIIDLTED